MIDIKRNKKILRNRRKNYQKDKSKIFIYIVLAFLIGLIGFETYTALSNNNKQINNKKEEKINYLDYYHDNIETLSNKKLYKLENEEFIEVGEVSSNIELSLSKDEYLDKGYFKINDLDYYIDYKDIKEKELSDVDNSWKNYIPFNESIVTETVTKLYKDDKLIYSINEGMTLPIIFKNSNNYGVVYKDKLFNVLKEEVSVIKSNNTELKHTNGISALVYHATYDHTNQEEKVKCINANSTICLSDIQFDEQMKYLKDNNFYTATMKDVELFVDGVVQLPEHTVVITIDDGYFADAAVKVLEKYDLHATLFLIGVLSEVDEWKTDAWYSKSLELHSHTYHMHDPGKCPGGQGSPLKCLDKDILLADLKKSREQLNGSTIFCYPFFEYNDYAINVLKEAGFTMAFAGGRQKIKVGSDKMKLPRYGVINTFNINNFINIIY